MKRRQILPSVFLAIWLAGCATSADLTPAAPDAPNLPAVPADVMACAKNPVVPPDRELDAGELERLWKTDRAALAKVNGCLRRLICQDQETRQQIGKVEGAACAAAAPAAKHPGRYNVFGKRKDPLR